MKKTLSSSAGALLLALVFVTTHAVADPITGSLSFNGAPNFNVVPISAATAITSYDSATVAVGQQTGVYAAVPDMFPVTFSPFTFSPATQLINPLWTFDYLGLTYSFNTTSTVADFNAALNIWNFGGNGILHVTGFDDTAGAWNFSAGQIGQSFYFGAATAATGNSVPDGGMTVLLLGFGLSLVGMLRLPRRAI